MSKKDKHKPKAEEARDEEARAEAEQPAEADRPEQPKTVTEERDDLLARLQRVSADYVNYQKRVQHRDVSQVREYANEELMKALLSVLDDMERALAAARENHADDDPLLTGMQLVHDKALETLGRFGLSAIEAEGKRFDPERHSAMMQEPSDEHPPMTVLRELQKGYRLKGRTLRPSAVIVAKPPEQEDPQEAQPQDADASDGPEQDDPQ